jgi:MarR family transcriptional regulator for hemolysin
MHENIPSVRPPSAEQTTAFLVVDVARLIRQRFERAVAAEGLGLTAGEARTLLHASCEEGIRQTLLAERMHVEPMTLTGFLDRLEVRGLIAREVDPDDRRAKRIRITTTAVPTVERVRALAASVREGATEGLKAEEVEALRRALLLMRNNLALGLQDKAA